MTLDDPRWEELSGGYKLPYDPRPDFEELSTGDSTKAWQKLWTELHHQGDIGEASYAAIPILVNLYRGRERVDWNLFALAAVIEVERHRKTNPALPDWLADDYHEGWEHLRLMALAALDAPAGKEVVRSALGVLAISGGMLKLGALIMDLDSSLVDELLDQRMKWTSLYREDRGVPVDR